MIYVLHKGDQDIQNPPVIASKVDPNTLSNSILLKLTTTPSPLLKPPHHFSPPSFPDFQNAHQSITYKTDE